MKKIMKKVTQGFSIILILGGLNAAVLSGCAKLPFDNEAPEAPVVTSSGVMGPYGVEIMVTVDDPDGDMVSVRFTATNSGDVVQEFTWTSFISSGVEEVFVLGLSQGQWTLSAQAKDEIDELSPTTTIDLTVSLP